MRREGKKKHPIYKLVAADSRSPRNGGYLEALGQYDPHRNPVTLKLKEQRIEHWLRKGAQPTDTVRSLLRRNGFWLQWTLTRQGKDEATVKSVMERWQMLQADKPKREADRKLRRAERKKKAAPAAEAPAPAPAAA
ncbi:MAG: 30S ribosomal protein S16 [Bacteroidetes bacterium]|nr:30S ribosomal protein S16 [Bacteroidota bacterium]